MKINKAHEGKEFQSYFKFIGQVKKHYRGMGADAKPMPIYELTKTKTNKDRRVLQFDILTAKGNKLKVELAGMEQENVYLYSSTEKKSFRMKWQDRFNKNKYPNDTYHLMDTPWDLSEKFGENLKEGDWVQVSGNYEFDTFTKDDGTTTLVIKRIISRLEPIEEGKEVYHFGEKFNYICDIDSPDFKEVNYFKMEIAINSTYQDEDIKDTLVNGFFLTYGKEKSSVKDVKLTVYYKKTGKKTLADAFALLNRGDFLKVEGVDNNRVEYTWVDKKVEAIDDDPFADVEEKTTEKERVINGNKKGLEIVKFIKGSLIKEFLTEEEMDKGVDEFLTQEDEDEDEDEDEKLPF